MKKLVIILAIASLHTGSAFAAGAAGEAIKAGEGIGTEIEGGTSIRPGQVPGGTMTAPGVAPKTVSRTAGTSSAAQQPAAPAATGVDSHVTCPTDSPMGQLPTAERNNIFAAVAAGVGGSAWPQISAVSQPLK